MNSTVKKVLVLDNDEVTQAVFRSLRHELGPVEIESLNPQVSVLSVAKKQLPDLIFLSTEHIAHPDFKLMDMFNLTTLVNIPVIYLSTLPLAEDEKEIYQKFYLPKPLEVSSVKDTIKSILNL